MKMKFKDQFFPRHDLGFDSTGSPDFINA